MKKILLLSLALPLGACDASYGGAGVAKSGTPFSGEIVTDVQRGGANVVLMSPSGLRCEGFVANYTEFKPISTRQLPLACNDGQTGNAILTADRAAQRLTASFQLSRGETGNIVFGG